MANKTANVLARVEPETKREAEEVMQKLGISASTVINLLYNQIILTKSIPFPLALPREPKARDEITDEEFSAMLQKGADDVQAGRTRPAKEVFTDLRQGLS